MKDRIIIDFSDCLYPDSLHNEIKDKLELPDWYGKNLDALWDSLTGIIETPVEIKIIFKPKTKAAKKAKPYISQIVSVFKDAEKEYGEIKLLIDMD
ncbi:MAG: barstar family protein [Clostridiales bacterium]|nr:barstar family protein [Clostridiales bacterium]